MDEVAVDHIVCESDAVDCGPTYGNTQLKPGVAGLNDFNVTRTSCGELAWRDI
jgi:hypothetical protein